MADLGDILIERGQLDRRGLERARDLSRASGQRLDQVLSRMAMVADDEMAGALAAALDLPLAADFPDRPLLGERVTPQFLRNARVLPLAERDDGLDLAMADPQDDYTRDAMRLLVGKPVRPFVAAPATIAAAIDRLYGTAAGPSLSPAATQVASADIERLADHASDAPVIRLVDRLIAEALAERASDIHLEPAADGLRLRLRVDGVLRPREAPPASLHPALVSRIKVMAGLDIAERRLPQDGRTSATVQGRDIDVRVSTLPTVHGESVVLRLLDREQAPLDLHDLGFAADLRDGLDGVLQASSGIVLVTGPTGSGKTTTLYAALNRIDTGAANVVTVEDPVEYRLPGINQIQVRPRIGLDFATVLRSVLRHDPDVVLIGEIRDGETARIAVQAALTGHLVLSTLHTNDAASAVTRLTDMGVEPYLITSTLRAVLAQRLVRRLCASCARQVPAGELGQPGDGTLGVAAGCAACGDGYRGRAAIGELLTVDDELRRLVLTGADSAELRRHALGAGMRSLRDDGMRKASAGETSLEEVLRVTQAGS
ncbi:MAG: ATPase, T2SS/T4P/T4SS family [Alphaproteobacteria bacterium]